MKNTFHTKGFALMEMVMYIVFLSVLVLVIVGSLQTVLVSYRQVKVHRAIETGAIISLERLTKEIKNGISVDQAGSVFNSATSSITINGKSPAEAQQTTYIYAQNGILKLSENAGTDHSLTGSSTYVTSFTLNFIDGTNSDAVKIALTLRGGSGALERSETFYSTAILKGSY